MYVTYRTTYLGDKMPKYYLGSSNEKRIHNGYIGSVSSKKYRDIWNKELIENPHLFSIEILTKHSTRQEAIEMEQKLQVENDVVNSIFYINESIARKNGFFGRDVSGSNNPMFNKRGENNPNYGSKRSEETRQKMRIKNSRPMSEEQKEKIRTIRIGTTLSEKTKVKLSESLKGKKDTDEARHKKSEAQQKLRAAGLHFSQKVFTCPHCNKVGKGVNMKRYHFNKCKFIS